VPDSSDEGLADDSIHEQEIDDEHDRGDHEGPDHANQLCPGWLSNLTPDVSRRVRVAEREEHPVNRLERVSKVAIHRDEARCGGRIAYRLVRVGVAGQRLGIRIETRR